MRKLFAIVWIVLAIIYIGYNISDLMSHFSFSSIGLILIALIVIAFSVGDLKNSDK